MIVRKTRPEEARRVNELFSIAFDIPLGDGPANPANGRIYHVGAFAPDDKAMMANISVNIYTVNFDGHPCKMGGIGGVATLPQHRRQGCIRGCFELALPDMYENGYDFSYLYPFSTAYYRKFGYETCTEKFRWTVDLSLWRQEVPEGTWVLAEKDKPMTQAIRALDRLWERKYNMMVLHTPEDYDWTEKFDPAVSREHTYVCFDAGNNPRAYTTFRTAQEDGRRCISCSRFCFDGREGFLLLMGLFKTMASDFSHAVFQTPMEWALQYYAGEWSLGAVKWEVLANSGMVRVINVPGVLKKAKYRGSGQAVLAVTDPQIPENSGTWKVVFRESRALSVEKTEEPADAVLTIQAFSALICGVLELEAAEGSLGGLQVLNAGELNKVFYPKSRMITDFF